MHNNYHFIVHLAAELSKKLVGKQLGTCFTQNKDEMVLGFYSSTEDFFIVAKLQQHFSILNFTDQFARAKRNTVDIWSELLDQKVQSVDTFENERCFQIKLENEDILLLKLFGNRSNVIWFKGEKPHLIFKQKLKVDLDHDLATYQRPIKQNLAAYNAAEGNVSELFPTYGKLVLKHLEKLGYQNPPKTKDFESNWELITEVNKHLATPHFHLIRERDQFKLSLIPTGEVLKSFDRPTEALNEFSRSYFKELRFTQLKRRLLGERNKRLTQVKNFVLKNRQKLKKFTSGSSYHQIGDLIMANLYNIESRATQVTLLNFYTNSDEVVKLKKDLNPQKNAEWYYRKGKNQNREIEFLEKSIKAKEREGARIAGEIEQINDAQTTEDLKPWSKKAAEKSKKTVSPFRQFEFQGYQIWIGKSSKNNDLLTTKYAQKEDIWLHARDTPGSHVVIKNPAKGVLPPTPVIEYAAQLAAYYSKRKTESLCPVAYTFKKYVRKPKGSLPGAVVMDKEAVILVEPLKPD